MKHFHSTSGYITISLLVGVLLFLGACATTTSNAPLAPSVQTIIAVKDLPDDNLAKIGKEKAKELGLNPVFAYLTNQNEIKSNKSPLTKGDMLINVGKNPFTVNNAPLKSGEYIKITDKTDAQDVSSLAFPQQNDGKSNKIIMIKGKLADFKNIKKAVFYAPYLSLVKVYKKGSKDAPLLKVWRKDEQGNKTSLIQLSPQSDDCALIDITGNGRLVYFSELSPIQIPPNDTFTFKIIDLEPGHYIIAAYNIANEFSYFSKSEAEEPIIINIPEGYHTPVEIDLGLVYIPERTKWEKK